MVDSSVSAVLTQQLMIMLDDIAIVTVVLNDFEGLRRTLMSVRELKDIVPVRYIVVDGGSCDGTLSVCNQNFDIIDQLISEPDNGIYHAMNKGLGVCPSGHVLFLNAGDTLISTHLADFLKSNPLQRDTVYYSDLFLEDYIDFNSKSPGEPRYKVVTGSVYGLYWNMTLNHPTMLTPVCALKNCLFNESYKIAADYDVAIRLKKNSHINFKKINLPIARMERNVASSDIKRSDYERFLVQRTHFGVVYAIVRSVLTYGFRSVSAVLKW